MSEKDDQHQQYQQVPSRFYATSIALERILDAINRESPINLEFATVPFRRATVSRIRSLEMIYAKSRLFRFLVRKGVNPIILFVGLSAGLAATLRRFYQQSTYLALNLVGVAYPAWRCWYLVKEHTEKEHQSDNPNLQIERIREYKSWLTYWMLYGSLQVLDNWASDLTLLLPKYNVYKLLLLYWAQSPHSFGASVLCHHVLQKPSDRYPSESSAMVAAPPLFPSITRDNNENTFSPCYSSSSSVSTSQMHGHSILEEEEQHDNHHHRQPLDGEEDQEQFTLTIERRPTLPEPSTSILDGYMPPPLIVQTGGQETTTITHSQHPKQKVNADAYCCRSLKIPDQANAREFSAWNKGIPLARFYGS